jgi:hypothetical protein
VYVQSKNKKKESIIPFFFGSIHLFNNRILLIKKEGKHFVCALAESLPSFYLFSILFSLGTSNLFGESLCFLEECRQSLIFTRVFTSQ